MDGGIDLADKVFAETLFKDEDKYLNIWRDLPLHVLQEDEPGSDRHWVESSPTLQVHDRSNLCGLREIMNLVSIDVHYA